MGSIVATYIAPPAGATAAWVLDTSDFSFYAQYTGDSLDFALEDDFSDFAGAETVTDTQLSSGPVNYTKPVITGPTSYGYVMTATTGVWLSNFKSNTFAYRWYRDGVFITGATSSTYTTVLADQGATLTCGVIATDSNGSSGEELSVGFDMRATAWTQNDVVFDGASRLQFDEDLFVNTALRVGPEGETFGAYSMVLFFSGTLDASPSQNVPSAFAYGATRIGVRASQADFSAVYQAEADGDATGSVTQDWGTYTAADRGTVLLYVRQSTPGNIEGVYCALPEGGSWTYTHFERSGPLISTQGGSFAVGDRPGGGRPWDGSLSRVAAWCNIPDINYLTLFDDISGDPPIVDLFMQNSTTLRPPDVATGILGTPLIDFNGDATDWNAGTHDGSIGLTNFVKTGILT